MSDVNNPSHYNAGSIEVIEVIEDWKLGFHAGNVIKYIARAAHKGTMLTDLKKAQWYLNRLIQKLEDGSSDNTNRKNRLESADDSRETKN